MTGGRGWSLWDEKGAAHSCSDRDGIEVRGEGEESERGRGWVVTWVAIAVGGILAVLGRVGVYLSAATGQESGFFTTDVAAADIERQMALAFVALLTGMVVGGLTLIVDSADRNKTWFPWTGVTALTALSVAMLSSVVFSWDQIQAEVRTALLSGATALLVATTTGTVVGLIVTRSGSAVVDELRRLRALLEGAEPDGG